MTESSPFAFGNVKETTQNPYFLEMTCGEWGGKSSFLLSLEGIMS
jgi:hypothetical protein